MKAVQTILSSLVSINASMTQEKLALWWELKEVLTKIVRHLLRLRTTQFIQTQTASDKGLKGNFRVKPLYFALAARQIPRELCWRFAAQNPE